MSSKNKFGFAPVTPQSPSPRRNRAPGPMGAAVREAAEDLSDATEAKVEQRRQNAADAKAFRAAQAEGRVLVNIPVDDIQTDDLPRDRMELEQVASSEEMEELKSSIRARGQKEPIEVYRDAAGALQLKKGWRRLTALRQLLAETREDAFSTVVARIEAGESGRISHYIDMVEENVVREDLTFAEMAQVAILAAQDPEVGEPDPAEMVNRLYAALHKTKRSYIRAFVFLMNVLGDGLRWPREIPRNLGVEASRAIRNEEHAQMIRDGLASCADADGQNKVLSNFLAMQKRATKPAVARKKLREKFEFHVGETKVTAREGEVRLIAKRDFAGVPRSQLQEAVEAFEAVLNGRPRVRKL